MQQQPFIPRAAFAPLCLVPLIASAWPLQADDWLDPILVTTPTRMAQTVDDSLHPVTVLNRDDIERLQPPDLPALLRGLPGVQVSSSGGFGKQSSVFLRGANSNQVIVLIDGVRAGSATAGGAAWEFLPVDLIDRVEIVRGPRSSAYGADAVGGVIQIFTRGSEGKALREVSVGYGRFNTLRAGATLSGSAGAARYTLGLSHQGSDGYDVRRGGDPDADGFRNTAGNLRLGYRFDGGLDVEARLLHTQGRTDFDNAFGMEGESREDFVQQAGSLKLSAPVGTNGAWQIVAGETRDERDTSDAGFDYRFDTRRRSVSAQTEWDLGAWQWLAGADHVEDRVSGSADFQRESRRVTAGFLQVHADWAEHRFGAGLRHDEYNDFGGQTTGDLAWGYRPAAGWDLRAGFGTAFRAPTFNDLYFPWGGNPDLRPEESRNVEAGASWTTGPYVASVNVFENRITDLIVLDTDFVPRNAARARITGTEMEWNWNIEGWRASAAYTWLRARDRDTGNRLPRRAEHSGRLDVDRELGRLGLGASLIAQGKRYDNLSNTITLPAFATLDLRASYRLDQRWRVSASWSNVLDKDYETAAGYPQPGQALQVELRGSF